MENKNKIAMNLQRKKLLVLGAGRGHLGLIKTAKRLGVESIVTGLEGNYPCNAFADKICYADIADESEVLKVAIAERVDGVVICCSDTGLRAVGRVCDRLDLCGLTEKAAVVSSDKCLMKEALIRNGVRTAQFRKVSTQKEILSLVNEWGLPLVIKAVDLQGSKGISIVRDVNELGNSFEEVMRSTKKDFCIIEQYIEGREFGAQSFVYEGYVLFVLPHGDETYMCKTAVPIGHYIPIDNVSNSLLDDVNLQVKKAIKALGLNNCAVNVDFIEKDGKAYIIELTGRVGANCLPELVSYYWDIDYYEMIICMALGENPIPIFERRSLSPNVVLAKMLKANMSGQVASLHLPIVENGYITMFISEGSNVRKFANSNDAIGEMVIKGKTMNEVEEEMDSLVKQIKIIIQ